MSKIIDDAQAGADGMNAGARVPSRPDYMGTAEAAKIALLEAARVWRAFRQPRIATRAEHRRQDALEAEAQFRLANAAVLWLWHEENPPSTRALALPPHRPIARHP